MVCSTQRFGKKALGRVNNPVLKYTPLALDPDVGQSPPANCRWSVGAAVAIGAEFLGVTLDPPPDGDVVDQKSTLSKEFLDVTVRQ
jgi:hypothetical protein